MGEIQIVQGDQGGSFEANKGDTIVVRLEENITTGYQWEPLALDSSVLALLSEDHASDPGHLMGRSGTCTLRFEAISPGSAHIRTRLRRPWESEDAAIGHFDVNIRVR